MSNRILQLLRDNREKLKLVVYFVVVLILAYPLSQLLGQAWQNANLTRSLIRVHLIFGLTRPMVNVFFLGIFVGFLTLMTIDPKKRIQGVLLWIALTLSLIVLESMQIFIWGVDLVETAPWLVGGLVLGLLVGGGRKLLRFQTAEALEFRRAALGIYYGLVAIVLVAFLEYHLTYPRLLVTTTSGITAVTTSTGSVDFVTNGIFQNLVVSSLFIVTVREFVQYDAEQKFFILGPRASGKSLFLIGAYLEALGRTTESAGNTPLNPSNDLMSMIQELDRRESEWIVEATGRGEINNLAFQYVHGSVFPTNIQLESADYAGEYLSRLPDAIAGVLPDDSVDSTLERLVDGVETADTLILLLDMERFMNDEPLEITEYFDILQQADNKGVILVATKADTMAEEFREQRGLEAHRYFDEFKEYVNERLRGSQQVQSLVQETAGTDIYPVYYQTTVNDNGDRVPIRDDTNSVMTVGFDELLDLLGRRA